MAKCRLKTTSNGSLHSTYTAYGSHLPSSSVGSRGQVPAQRRPLRSISQNSTLPPSPGPLLSMLKTTTEMGDVGAFPIRQRPVTPTAYHQLPRSRPELVAATPPPRYTPKRSDALYYADDHKPFRSYRDTTSEIISLYAYDNQPFYFGSGSPMLDDSCHRSYSITTNSSRHLPSQKSSAIMQSHSSGGEVQRPRSPFPYPTRLKRPGVRPASPAVAGNGCVDYSRMVELDRVSQRTVHNSYKANSLKWARRPPPLSIRPDYSRSAASLPLRASPNTYHAAPGSHRSRTPSSSQSSASRYGRFERHPRKPTEHGERSPSLSSIVGMYRRPSSAKRCHPQTPTACQFYYDYSEDFDKPTVREIDIEQEQSVTHAVRYLGAGGEENCNPDAGEMADMDGAAPDDNSAEEAHKEGDISALMADKDRSDCSQDVSQLGGVLALRKLSRSAPPDGQHPKWVASQENREKQNELASIGDTPRSKLLRLSKTLGDKPAVNQLSDEAETHRIEDDAACSPEQTLPDFASIFGAFDLLDRSPYFKSTANLSKALDAARDTDSTHSADHVSHRHKISAMGIIAADLGDESGFSLSRSAQDQELDILSPEPISPVRGLKVKNSIPQLMKALPPLPSKLSQYVQNAVDATILKDDGQPVDGACRDEDVMQDGLQEVQTRSATLDTQPSKESVMSAKRSSPSKFKVRVKSTTSQMLTPPSGASYSKDPAPLGEVPRASASQPKPKLKIKISRSQLGQGRCTTDGANPRVNRMKDCNSLADLALYSSKPRKMADGLDVAADKNRQDSCREKLHQSFDGAQDLPVASTSISPQPSDPFNIPYPSSPDDNARNNRSISSSSNKDTLVPRPSCSSDTVLHHEHGLRKKMSMFRLRIVESLTANAAKKGEKAEELQRSESHLSVNMTSKDSETNFNVLSSRAGRSNKLRSDWMATRVKRWAMDARRAVRLYVRRTLDRTPRGSEQ